MIWCQTLYGPLYRFADSAPDSPEHHKDDGRIERCRNMNLEKGEANKQKVLGVLTHEWQSTAEIARKTGVQRTNVSRRLHSLGDRVETKLIGNAGANSHRYWRLRRAGD